MNGKTRIKTVRVIRAVNAVALIVNVAFALTGRPGWVFNAGVAVFLALVMCFQTFVIRRLRVLDRPRPDYGAIARMEREVYGEGHPGRPGGLIRGLRAPRGDA